MSEETQTKEPWEDIFGRFNDDPSWEGFPRWLDEQYGLPDEEVKRKELQANGADIVRQPHEKVNV